MERLLIALRGYPVSVDVLDELRRMPEWDDARSWGRIMESGELTDIGSRHAGKA